MKCFKKFLAAMTAAMVCLSALPALAQGGLDAEGKVVNIRELPVTANVSGTVVQLTVREGSRVKKGDTIAQLKTTKVYATESGTVRLFGQAGDSAENLTARYGAVAYVEPDLRYYLSASTKYAYDAEENLIIHPGEQVFLRGAKETKHTGKGVVTTVDGTSYTIEITEGSDFEKGEYVYAFRKQNYEGASRIGRGSVKRSEYTAYQGSGVVVRYCVEDGAHVNKGDVLFETVEGSFTGYGSPAADIKADCDGVVSSLSVTSGGSVSAGDVVCCLYPDEALRVEADVEEEDLASVKPGKKVNVAPNYAVDGASVRTGTVEEVSSVGTAKDGSDETTFKVIIRLDDASGLNYGTSVTVTD
ncbi:MAG: biotin/lipoyl-binding protein [Clostridia bacterium]|nr:biotin/lipoyl-binding protein [Clostridia bacterium]